MFYIKKKLYFSIVKKDIVNIKCIPGYLILNYFYQVISIVTRRNLTSALFIFIQFWVGLSLFAQKGGVPFINIYDEEDYDGSLQNWAVIQDQQGRMYFGNSAGLIVFDGKNWQNIIIPNGVVRSLGKGKNGTIYIGGRNEFGFITINDDFLPEYISLKNQLSDSIQFQYIHSIVAKDDEIYLQGESYLFRFNEKTKSIKTWKTPYSYHRIFTIDNQIFIRQEGIGLSMLKNDELVSIDSDGVFAEQVISAMIKTNNGKVLIGSRNQGIYELLTSESKFEIRKMQFAADDYLKQKQIYNATSYYNNEIIWATVNGGVVITDASGSIRNIINDDNGLTSNFVGDVYIDHQNALWAATGRGIAYIEINFPIQVWNMNSGLKGVVHDIIRYQDILYVATEEGVFYLNRDQDKFKKIPNIGIQSWYFLPIDLKGYRQLLVSSTDGIYEVHLDGAKPIYESRTRILFNIKSFPGRIFIGSDDGFFSMILKNGSWEYEKDWLDDQYGYFINEATSYDRKEEKLWVRLSGEQKVGLMQFYYQEDGSNPENLVIQEFDSTKINSLINIVEYNDTPLFLTKEEILEFDHSNNEFNKSSINLNQLLGLDTSYTITFLHQHQDSTLWFAALRMESIANSRKQKTDNILQGMAVRKDGNYELALQPYIGFPDVIGDYYAEGENSAWLGGNYGLYLVEKPDTILTSNDFEVFINSVAIGNGDSTIFSSFGSFDRGINGLENIPQINFSDNTIKFDFASNSYSETKQNQYSILLEGLDEEWSPWLKETNKIYSGLPNGSYVFNVRSRNAYGYESSVASYQFVVLKPWYRTIYAYIGYFLSAGLIIWGIVKINVRRLQAEKKYLEEVISQRTMEVRLQNQELEKQKAEISEQASNLKKVNFQILDQNRKIEAQKEEITSQRDQLSETNQVLSSQKEELERAYHNIKLLGDMGKQITSHLSIDDIAKVVYRNLNTLMDANVFAIGIFNEKEKRLEFRVALENQRKMPLYYDSLEDENQLSTWCFRNQNKVFIRDFDKDYPKYLPDTVETRANELTESIIYLPLSTTKRSIGVITVQSYQKNAYTKYHLNLLRNIVVYINIALENAENFEAVIQHSLDLEKAYQDIQEQKMMIENQNQELVDLNNEKNHIIGIVAHDLRNPLTSSLTMIGILKSFPDDLNEDQIQCIEVIDKALYRMNNMITRILDIKAIESKRANLQVQKTNLNKLLKLVHHSFKETIEEKDLTIHIPATNIYGKVDPNYTMQIFENLLSNAIKFSPPQRKIYISLYTNDGKPRFEISDQGPGISQDDMKKLFNKYQTLSAKPTGGEKSTGLGLSIVKKYVEAMNGRVWCESEAGKGAKFVVEFDGELVKI